jgi:hypothetical protein
MDKNIACSGSNPAVISGLLKATLHDHGGVGLQMPMARQAKTGFQRFDPMPDVTKAEILIHRRDNRSKYYRGIQRSLGSHGLFCGRTF